MFCEIASGTVRKVGEVERYWTGGRINVFHSTLWY